jgi:hypothetical protein
MGIFAAWFYLLHELAAFYTNWHLSINMSDCDESAIV